MRAQGSVIPLASGPARRLSACRRARIACAQSDEVASPQPVSGALPVGALLDGRRSVPPASSRSVQQPGRERPPFCLRRLVPASSQGVAHARYFCLFLQQHRLLEPFYRKCRSRAESDPTGVLSLCELFTTRRPGEIDEQFQTWLNTSATSGP